MRELCQDNSTHFWCANRELGMEIIYLIAPHIYCHQLIWLYSNALMHVNKKQYWKTHLYLWQAIHFKINVLVEEYWETVTETHVLLVIKFARATVAVFLGKYYHHDADWKFQAKYKWTQVVKGVSSNLGKPAHEAVTALISAISEGPGTYP